MPSRKPWEKPREKESCISRTSRGVNEIGRPFPSQIDRSPIVSRDIGNVFGGLQTAFDLQSGDSHSIN